MDLSYLVDFNNRLAETACKQSKIKAAFRLLFCGARTHSFTRTDTSRITGIVIERLVHHVECHRLTDTASLRVLHLKGRSTWIQDIHDLVRPSRSFRKIHLFDNAVSHCLSRTPLCLDEKVTILFTASRMRRFGVETLLEREELRREFYQAANHTANNFIQMLYSGTYRKFPVKPTQFFHACRHLITALDFSHPLYPINRIIRLFQEQVRGWESLLTEVESVKFGLVEAKGNPLDFVSRLIGRGSMRTYDTSPVRYHFLSPLDEELNDEVVSHFPLSTFGLWSVDPIALGLERARNKVDEKLEALHSHGQLMPVSLALAGEFPLIGPQIALSEKMTFSDPVIAFSEVSFYVSQMAESVLRLFEISHITGLSHHALEIGSRWSVLLTAIPVVGTALLSLAFGKHLYQFYNLASLRIRLSKLHGSICNATTDKAAQLAIKTFITQATDPTDKEVRALVLKARRGTDPRFFELVEEELLRKYAHRVLCRIINHGQKEIFKSFHEAFSLSRSKDQILDLIGRVTRNVNQRLALKIFEVAKTGLVMGLTIGGIFTPFPLIVSTGILLSNILLSIEASVKDEVLCNETFTV